MKIFSNAALVHIIVVLLFPLVLLVGSATSSFIKSTQNLHSVTVTSEDITSAYDAIIPDIPRVLKNKASAKEPKVPKSGNKKEPKVSKSRKKKVSKSNKVFVTASPSTQQTLQPSLQPTNQCAAAGIIAQKDALLALKGGFYNGDAVLNNWNGDIEPCSGDSSNWGETIICNSNGKVERILLCKCSVGACFIHQYPLMHHILEAIRYE